MVLGPAGIYETFIQIWRQGHADANMCFVVISHSTVSLPALLIRLQPAAA